MADKYFMITTVVNGKSFANVYSSFGKMKEVHSKYKESNEIKELNTFLLNVVEKGEDMYVASFKDKLYACFDAKEIEHLPDGVDVMRVAVQEIKVK
jgi:hypothetical protein